MRKFLLILFGSLSLASGAQVGIGTTNPDNTAVLELNSNSKGILIPRMTSGERTGISGPATGLMVYDITVNQFYYYNGSAWVQAIGPAGVAGVNGKTILSGAGVPAAGQGTNGDFYLNTTNTRLYGPKAAGAWGSGVSLIGSDGPQGVQGPAGPSGVANHFPLLFDNPIGVQIVKSAVDWIMYPVSQVALPAGGALVNMSASISTATTNNLAIECNICYSASGPAPTSGTPITNGISPIALTQRLGINYEVIGLSGKVAPPAPGIYWIGPCFRSTIDNLMIKAVMGYGLVIQ